MSEANGETAIEIIGASVYIDNKHILKDLSLNVPRGQHTFILGANGAGKTTLVKMLMGYAWPLYGATVRVLGQTYGECNLVQARKKIAWVSPCFGSFSDPADTGMTIVLSGYEGTTGFAREATTEEYEKACRILGELDSMRLAEQRFATMSSGEQLRILIARALVNDPELLILDEASVYLDIFCREYLLETITSLAAMRPDMTIVFITQRIEDIVPVFKHGLILHEGEIKMQGERDEVLTEENLLKVFRIPIKLVRNAQGRYWPVIE